MREDLQHLQLLAVFHYVLGGLSALCACFPVIHLTLGVAMVSGRLPAQPQQGPPMQLMGWLFVLFATAAMVLGWAYAVGMVIAGRCLQRRLGYTFCLVMAALSCAHVPLGTVLGVFTLIVLSRPSVKDLFRRAREGTAEEEMDMP
jgi:hypothetical protein